MNQSSVPRIAHPPLKIKKYNNLDHVFSSSGQDIQALITGPVSDLRHFVFLVAKTKTTTDVLVQDEFVVNAASHVSKPHIQGSLAVNVGGQLGADGQLQDADLLGQALLGQQAVDEVGGCGLTFVAGHGTGSGDGSDGGKGKNKVFHDDGVVGRESAGQQVKFK